jgi:phage FluMu protein Com
MASSEPRLQIRTQHCTFCNHLLLATTRDISTLPRRGGEAKDKAIILPLEDRTIGEDADINEAQGTRTKHATLLLSTTIPDRRATLIRREDGIEKRVLLRCGRCKAVMGYYLDSVHYGEEKTKVVEDDDGNVEEKRPAVYILPGAIVETDKMGGNSDDAEWRGWNNEA